MNLYVYMIQEVIVSELWRRVVMIFPPQMQKKICFSKAQIHLREVRSRSKLPVCNHSTLYSVVYIYYSCIESAGTMHDNLCQETKNKYPSPHISHFRGINWKTDQSTIKTGSDLIQHSV